KDTVAAETYVVAAGTGFELSKSYVLRFAAGDDTASVNVEGRYNDAAIGAGSASASLIIQTLDGTAVQTATIPGDLYGGTSLSIFVDNHAVSAMDGYAYKYALVFRNDGQTQTTVKIVGVGSSTPFDGYDVAVVDASGNCVTKVNTAAPEGTYELNGLESTTLYIMFIKKTADVTESLPATLEVYYEFDGAISDNTTIDLASAEISVDAGSVTGGNADNSEKEVPTGFWILVVFAVLLILLIIWGGMKRGVFSRRN
ncbi:MAG: hypothetical protein MJZ38_07490, partial [archaeon]|nr:hypothetical protein [archaeon]